MDNRYDYQSDCRFNQIPNKYNREVEKHIVYGKSTKPLVKPKSSISSVFGVIFIICFFISMIGFVISSITGNEAITMLTFGQLFFGVGIIILVSKKDKLNNLVLLAFPLIGGGFMISGAFSLSGNKFFIDMITMIAPYIFVAIFFVIGATLSIATIISQKIKEMRCTIPLDSKVVDIKSKYTSKRVYSPVYEYYYNGKIYQQWSEVYTNTGVQKLDDRLTIYINPADPTDFYIKKSFIKDGKVILGFIFISFSLWAFIVPMLTI